MLSVSHAQTLVIFGISRNYHEVFSTLGRGRDLSGGEGAGAIKGHISEGLFVSSCPPNLPIVCPYRLGNYQHISAVQEKPLNCLLLYRAAAEGNCTWGGIDTTY